MKRYLLAMTAVLLVFLVNFLIVTSAIAAEKWPSPVMIGSFSKGSASYPVNVAMAQLISKYAPSKAVVREYAGGTPGTEALVRGDIHTWSQGQGDFISAYYGTGFWKDKPQDIRLLIGIWFLGPIGLGIRPKEGIQSVKDLAGKKCMVRSLVPFQNQVAETVMRHAGVWDKATILEMATTSDIAPSMIEKKVDCFIWSIGGAYSLEIKTSVGMDWISFTEEEQRAAVAAVPGVVAWTAPRWILDMYGYPPNKILRSVAYCFAFAVRSDMPDHVAYGILNAVYGDKHLDEVRSLSKDLTDTTLDLAVRHFWLPLHSGAVRFYKDKGVWTGEMEAKQKEFLAKRGFSK